MKIKRVDLNTIYNSINEPTIEVSVNDIFKASSGGDGNLNSLINENPSEELSVDFLSKILNNGLYNYNVDSFEDILEVEEILLSYDKSDQLNKLGCNILLSLEFALLKLITNNKPFLALNKHPDKFPLHLCNCIVTNFSPNKPGFQETLLIPKTNKFSDSFFANSYVHKRLNNILKTTERNYYGSYISEMKKENVLFYLEKLTNEVTKKLGIEFSFGLNINSESIFKDNIYKVGKENFLINEHINEINKLTNRFDIEYLEDPLSSKDIDLSAKIKVDYISGNRLIKSNLQNLKEFAKHFNCVVIKLNEVGSLGRLKKIVDFCKNNDINTILGQTLGETNDTILSDIAVGFDFDFIKYNIHGKERSLKLNELKRIENEYFS